MKIWNIVFTAAAEFLSGAVGIGRRLLHILDYVALGTGFVLGLFVTRTYADMIVGSAVVRRSRIPQTPPVPYHSQPPQGLHKASLDIRYVA